MSIHSHRTAFIVVAVSIGALAGCGGGGAETPQEAAEKYAAAYAAGDAGEACKYATDGVGSEEGGGCEGFVEDTGSSAGQFFADVESVETVDEDEDSATVEVTTSAGLYEFIMVNDDGWRVDNVNNTADDLF